MAISTDAAAREDEFVRSLRVEDAWALVEELSGLVRESGTEGEREAVRRITSRLERWGVTHAVHEPELWISLPGRAQLTVGHRTFASKTPSMAASTPPEGVVAQATYLPAGFARSVNDIFAASHVEGEVAGGIVVTEGMPMPGKVGDLEARGALGVVCIAPGARIHEGICTTIWGSPDLTTWGRQPRIPVVSVSNPDGRELIELLGGGAPATIVAEHETRWRPIPVVAAEIRGAVEPERFVLLHGHLDSWHVGVGDNATGDATLLEVARALHERREDLARSVRICWWSGHSHGRSPIRAGDISFNNLGVSTSFMLSSTMPDALREERGLYAVGGCGGNIEWHTEADTLDVADRDHLLRDIRVYGGAAFRAANLPVHPLDFRATLAQIEEVLRRVEPRGATLLQLEHSFEQLAAARRALEQLQAGAEREALDVGRARPFNDALLRAGRALVPVLYAREGRY